MTMKPRDFTDAQSIIDSIKIGTASRRDIVALLIYIREHLPEDFVRDIAHCVAHSDRDRGYTYSHIESFVANLIRLGNQGSGTLSFPPVFDKNDLVITLSKDLTEIGFDVEQADLERNYGLLKSRLTDILTGTKILLKHANVHACSIEEGDLNGQNILAFSVFFQGLDPNRFHFPAGTGIACPMFSE